MLQADGTHRLRDARSFTVDDGFCSLRRDIAWSKTGATGRNDEVEMLLIAPLAQRGLDLLAFIGDDRARADDGLVQLGDHRSNAFAAGIDPGTACATIADSKNSNCNHCLCLPACLIHYGRD